MQLISSVDKLAGNYGKLCSSYPELTPDPPRRSKGADCILLPIYADGEPEVVGSVRDVSQHGIGAKGIQSEVGKTKRSYLGIVSGGGKTLVRCSLCLGRERFERRNTSLDLKSTDFSLEAGKSFSS